LIIFDMVQFIKEKKNEMVFSERSLENVTEIK